MLETELKSLLLKVQERKCEAQTIEVKSANQGCPHRLYDTFSSFSNQDDGGVILFGLDETQDFKKVGVYDAQDLQKKLMEVGEQMSPVVRPVLTICDEDGMMFVSAEIPPVDVTKRPCFCTARGRMKGSYIRVGDADKPMTEYEVYSYEAFRLRKRDDIRPAEGVTLAALDQKALEEYLLKRRSGRPHLSALPESQLYELTGVTQNGQVTLAATLLFSPYPQAYFPQLSIIAARIPGTEMGVVDKHGQRFLDSRRMEGGLPEMLDEAIGFVQKNTKTAIRIDPVSGKRTDVPEYPMDAVREAVLNALVHRDYSMYTENMPIQLTLYADRLVITNPGGLYGRLTVDLLGKVQPDTRNPFLVTAMEALGQTENRYSGIPRIRRAMSDAGLPAPVFEELQGDFSVTLYNRSEAETVPESERKHTRPSDSKADAADKMNLLEFCRTPKNRKEILEYIGISSSQYAIKRYLTPLVEAGKIRLSNPDHPKSPKQTYQTVPDGSGGSL